MTTISPEKALAGDEFIATASITNTGDLSIKNMTVKVGDQTKQINLDLGDTVKISFQMQAPDGRGEYIYTTTAYTQRILLQEINTLQVESNPLTLRAHQQGENLNITINSNLRDSVITLEVYKKKQNSLPGPHRSKRQGSNKRNKSRQRLHHQSNPQKRE